MNNPGNVVSLKQYQKASRQALVDDISAQAFIFLREQAREHDLPMKTLLLEHMLGLALVVKTVEGAEEAVRVLSELGQQISEEVPH